MEDLINPFIENLTIELVKFNQKVNYIHNREIDNLSGIEIINNFTVEKQDCVKLYYTPYDDKFFSSFSSKTKEVIFYIMLNLEKEKDFILLDMEKVTKKTGISKNSFYKSIKDLIIAGLICKKSKSEYWINPKYIFRGNRKNFIASIDSSKLKIVYEKNIDKNK